eukprot:765278-Hanusia_phi.AAC.1
MHKLHSPLGLSAARRGPERPAAPGSERVRVTSPRVQSSPIRTGGPGVTVRYQDLSYCPRITCP